MGGLSTARAYLWTLSFYPVFAAISFGQNTLLSLFVFAATYRLLAAGRPFAAGLVAGLLAFKPPLLLGLVVWGLLDFRRLWPCAVGVVVTGVVLVLGSYPLVPAAWDGFVGTLRGNVAFDNFEQFKMHNPVAFWRLLLPADAFGVGDGKGKIPAEIQNWHWRLAMLCSAAAGWVFVRLWRKRRDDLPVMFGGAVFLTLWASPHALIYEWALLAVTGLLWWKETAAGPDRWFLLYAAAWVVLFVSTHFTEGQLLIQEYLGREYPVGVQLSVPVLGWAGWKAVQLLRRGREPGDRLDPPGGDFENRQ